VRQQNERPPVAVGEAVWHQVEQLDRKVLQFLRRVALPLLRISLGTVFIWFGLLKVVGETPVAELVANTAYWIDPNLLVPLLGAFEIIVGLGLLVGRGLRVVLALFVLQMIGTFLVLLLQPEIAFQGSNPLFLTTEGEFVIKNLVLLSAGLTIGSRLKALPKWSDGSTTISSPLSGRSGGGSIQSE
jgi:putative oxidoreductase